MPSIEELQRFQFQDFALENSRRGKLTVLGEHAFGAEQGRIVTAPVTSEGESSGGGGAVPTTEATGACCIEGECSIKTETECGIAGGEYQGDGTTCDPNPCPTEFCPYEVTITSAAISGSVPAGEECGGGDVELSGTVEGEPCAANATGDPCSCACTAILPVEYVCESPCPNPEKAFLIEVALVKPDCPDGDWYMDIDASSSVGNLNFCGNTASFAGSILTDENLGPDPTGTHIFSFDDPNDSAVHWDITVVAS